MRDFVIFVESSTSPETILKRSLYSIAGEMWMKVTKLEYVSERKLMFATFCGKTEQLLRLQTTLLPDGTQVTFKLRKPKGEQTQRG